MTHNYVPRQRTAVDGKIWWCVFDTTTNSFSTLLCFGKYKTKAECQTAIDIYKAKHGKYNHPEVYFNGKFVS